MLVLYSRFYRQLLQYQDEVNSRMSPLIPSLGFKRLIWQLLSQVVREKTHSQD